MLTNIKEITFLFQLEEDIRIIRPKSAVTDQYYESRIASGQKQTRILQDKVDHCLKHLSTVITKNRQLRMEIDHLLKERLV